MNMLKPLHFAAKQSSKGFYVTLQVISEPPATISKASEETQCLQFTLLDYQVLKLLNLDKKVTNFLLVV